jgi:two-component system response regulator (stage 0 sporulation protein F)
VRKNTISQAVRFANGGPPTRSHTCLRILVAEDEPDIRRLNTEVLADSGYQVDAAEDGAIAWDALNENQYDLLITDYEMPLVSGLELLQKLHDSSMEVPVIMATGTLPHHQSDWRPWLQIKAILLKPYTFTQLLGAVKNVLNPVAVNHPEIAPTNWQGHSWPNTMQH